MAQSHEIVRSDAVAEVARFAEVLGAPVYGQTVLQGTAATGSSSSG
jgi:hypothetical protein